MSITPGADSAPPAAGAGAPAAGAPAAGAPAASAPAAGAPAAGAPAASAPAAGAPAADAPAAGAPAAGAPAAGAPAAGAPAAASSGPVQYYALASGPIAFFDGSSDSTAGKQFSIPLSAITFTGGSPSFSLGSFPSAVQGGIQSWLEYLVNVGAIFPGPVIQSSGSSGSNSSGGTGA